MRHKTPAAALGLAMIAACLLAAVPARAQEPYNAPYDTNDAAAGDATPGAQAAAVAAQAAAPPPAENGIKVRPATSDGDLQQRLVALDNQLDDDQGDIRHLEAALADVRSVADAKAGEAVPEESVAAMDDGEMPFDVAGPDNDSAEEIPLVWRRLSMLVNVDLEYTSEYDTKPAKGTTIGSGDSPDFILPSGPSTSKDPNPNGAEGMFFKHMDLHFKYKFDDTMFAKLDYNVSALELDDCGVGWKDLPFPPFTSGWGDYTYSVFVGQKRQFFGLEQQTDSRNLMFPNRAMMYGGHNPFDKAATPAADPFDFFDQATTLSTGLANANEDDNADDLIAELVFERSMGIHFYHAHDFGFLNYSLGVDIVNNESEDSQDGQATDSLQLGFPIKTQDQDVSEIGRFSMEPRALDDFLPFGSKFTFGFSAFHDPENTAYYASQASQEEWADAQGVDGTFQSDRSVLYLQSEYVRRDQYGPSFNTATWTPNNEYGGLQGRAESWYVSGAFQPWRLFDPEAPRVELLARYESYYYDDVSNWLRLALGPYTGSFNATTIALKYTYEGNCHTSINYTTYGLNNNFNATGPTELLQLEQQVNF
jgi:hypothetical protein